MPTDPPDKGLKFGSKRLITEKVDERILRLLDLPSGHTIDYKTYHQRLKGKIRAAIVQKIPPEELALLSNEARRISGRTDRFRIVSKSVKIASTPNVYGSKSKGGRGKSAGGGPPSGPKITAKNILPPKGGELAPYQEPQAQLEPKRNPFIRAFDSINDSLGKVYNGLLAQNKESKRQEELDRREREGKTRDARESRLEGIFQGLIKTAELAIKPFKSMFDRIIDYFFNVFLGKSVLGIIRWINDPKNQEKLTSLKRFLIDYGPKLFAAYLLFGTKFGGMVTSLAATLVTQLAKLAKYNPVLAAALAAAGVITKVAIDDRKRRDAEKLQRQQRYAELITGKTESGSVAPGAYGPAVTQTPTIVPLQRRESGGPIRRSMNISNLLYKSGGPITEASGINITGAGADTQLIAAQPGEIVIPKKAVSLYGSEFFMNLIRSSGSTGIPKFNKMVQFAKEGGPVGNVMIKPMSSNLNNSTSQIFNEFGQVNNTSSVNIVGGSKKPKSSPGSIVDSALSEFMSGNKPSKSISGVPYSLPQTGSKNVNLLSMGMVNLNFDKSSNVGNINSSQPSKSFASLNSSSITSKNNFQNAIRSTPNLTSSSQSQQPQNKSFVKVTNQSSSPVTNNFKFVSKEPSYAPQPPTSSKISFIDLPPEIINSGQPRVNRGVNSKVDVPQFSSSANTSNRMTNIKIYF